MHKNFVRIPPFRPVVSSIGTYNYHLAKYLGTLLTPWLPMDYTASDTFTFIDDIQKVSMANKFMISFDVASLFTNIPLEETIELAVDLILTKDPNNQHSREDLTRLFEFATLGTNFLFEGIMYDQVDGVAMGSPLAPILANLFMGHHERRWIETFVGDKPRVYKRYVDDIFCLFDNKTQAMVFYHYINNQHLNIKFTFEEEDNNRLPFLDVLIDNNGQKITTSVFHKSTYTGLLTSYNSFVPLQYKIGLIRTLLDRTFRINNNWFSFDLDLKDLTRVLGRNYFPMWLIDKTVKGYLNKHFDKKVESVEEELNIDIRYFKLPFIGKYSDTFKIKLNDMIKKYCKNIDVKLIFTTCKLKDSFSCKDSLTSFSHTSKVIYKFVCANCNVSYIGETERNLSTRIKEHYKDKNSHVFKHVNASLACKNACNDDCFSVLDRASTKFQLRIKEGLYIKWEQPVLNKQLYCYNSQLFV